MAVWTVDVRLAHAAIGQGCLQPTRDEHDGQGPEKTLRQPVVLSVFWSRQDLWSLQCGCSTRILRPKGMVCSLRVYI